MVLLSIEGCACSPNMRVTCESEASLSYIVLASLGCIVSSGLKSNRRLTSITLFSLCVLFLLMQQAALLDAALRKGP